MHVLTRSVIGAESKDLWRFDVGAAVSSTTFVYSTHLASPVYFVYECCFVSRC